MKGQISVLKRYVQKGQLPDNSVATAAFFGEVDMVSFCLDEGVSIEREGSFGTPLRSASLMGHEMTVGLLIDRGADINARGKFGDALQAAAVNGHRSVTNLLIQNKADVNDSGGYYGNVLQAAAYRGHREVAEVLINAGARITDKGLYEDAFFAAAEAGLHAVVSLFIDQGFECPTRCRRRFKRSTYVDLLRAALVATQLGNNGKDYEKVPLPIPVSGFEKYFKIAREEISSKSHNSDVASEVHDSKAPPPVGSETLKSSSLVSAASKGRELVVQYMVTQGKRIRLGTEDLDLALRAAAEHGHVGVVSILLASGIELSWKISNSLKAAAQHGRTNIIQMLLEYDNDLECLSKKNAHVIAKYGSRGNQISTFQFCLSRADDKNKQILGARGFKQAAKFNSVGIFKSFHQYGDYTEAELVCEAFQAAAAHGSRDVVECFLANNHAKCLHRKHHSKAFRGASFYGHGDLAQFLLPHASPPCSPADLDALFINAAHNRYRGVLNVLLPGITRLDCCQTLLAKSLFRMCKGSIGRGFPVD